MSRRRHRSIVALVVMAASALHAQGVGAAAPSGPAWVPGEVLVGVGEVSAARASRVLAASGPGSGEVLVPRAGIRLVRTRTGESVPDAIARLRALPEVEWAEPNRVVGAQGIPNDPFLGEQYWVHATGGSNGGTVTGLPDADADVLDAWARTRGSESVLVAVVDSGIAYDNPDLAGAVFTNPGESGGGRETNRVDDDGNGFVDDWRGWDFDDDDNDPRDLGTFPHGSAVSGIIGARADDGHGIAGVAPRTRILPLRVMTPGGTATTADIVAAYGYAARMGARVVNASYGSPTASSAQRDAIAAAPGVLFVASAGNDGLDLARADSYPCEYELPNVLCVAATDERDALADFSNTGAASVDLAAPGVGVLTDAPPLVELYADDFEAPLAGRWITGGTGGTWTRSAGPASSGSFSLDDSAGGPYVNNARHWIRSTTPVDLTGRFGCRLDFQLGISSEGGIDGVFVETSTTGGATWIERDTFSGEFPELGSHDIDLTAVQGRPDVRFGFSFVTNGSVTGDGARIDDVAVHCLGGTPGGRDLIYSSGTSFAAPVVSGIAALLLAERPGLGVDGLRTAILAGVDPLPALAGRVATGGRASARRALDALPPDGSITSVDPARVERPSVTRSRTGVVTLRARLAGQAEGATGLLVRGGVLVRRLTLAGSGDVTLGLGKLPPGAYRATLAPGGTLTEPLDGIASLAFTVGKPARRTAALRTRGGQAETGAAGYRLPATPRPLVADGVVPLATGSAPVVLTCGAGGCRRTAGVAALGGDPSSALAATGLRRLLPSAAAPRALSATAPRRTGRRPATTLSAADDARVRVLAVAGGFVAEARLQQLAAAAERAGVTELVQPGPPALSAPVVRRPRLAAPAIPGGGTRRATLRRALADHAANEADVIALSRLVGGAADRLAAAQQAGSQGGVAQALRDAALAAPALGDAIARRPALRRRLATALAGADAAPSGAAAARKGILASLIALGSRRGLDPAEVGALRNAVTSVPLGRGVTGPLAPSLRDPALDRRDRALAVDLQHLAERL